MSRQYKVGDPVIYRKLKTSNHPSPNAIDVVPATGGEDYSYQIDKFWRVIEVRPLHQLVICTRRGKTHTIDDTDPALRRATWWERLLYRHRFPEPVRSDPINTDGVSPP
jgi:hypothetical protein